MANAIFSRNRRLYVTPAVTFGTAVAPTNSNASRHIDFSFSPQQNESQRPDLNPSLSLTVGTLGRKNCTFQGSASLAGSAAAGTAPDLGPFFKAVFGKQTINAGVSVVYEPDDVVNYVDIWQYVTPSTGLHEALLSAVVRTLAIEFGGDYAIVSFTGEGKSYVDSGSLTSLDTEGKCGLAAFPAEPGAPVVNGLAVSGYRGTITLDGAAYTIARNGRLTLDNGLELQRDGWGTDYPQAGAPGIRRATLDISLYDDDSANLNSLKSKATLGTSVDLSFVLGSVAGGIFTIAMNDVILGKPIYDNSQNKRIVNFNGCVAHATSGTSKNELIITIT